MNKKSVIALLILIVAAVTLTFLFMNRPTVGVMVYVDPQAIERTVGQNVTVNLSIADVTNLYAWEVKLAYNATVLEHVRTTEGEFLREQDTTFFTYNVNATEGYVLIDCTLLGNISGVNGKGTLAVLEFHVKQVGSCELDPYDTKLLDPSEQMINHRTTPSHVTANSQ